MACGMLKEERGNERFAGRKKKQKSSEKNLKQQGKAIIKESEQEGRKEEREK